MLLHIYKHFSFRKIVPACTLFSFLRPPQSQKAVEELCIFSPTLIFYGDQKSSLDFSAIVGNPRVILIDSHFHRWVGEKADAFQHWDKKSWPLKTEVFIWSSLYPIWCIIWNIWKLPATTEGLWSWAVLYLLLGTYVLVSLC